MSIKQPDYFTAHWSGIFITRTIGAWGILTGILIAIGGADRWKGNAYDELNLMPGSPFTWAAIIAMAGALIVIGSLTKIEFGRFSLRNIGLWLTALWCFFLVVGFIAASAITSTVSYNISTTYFLVGVTSIFLTKSRFTP